MSMGSPQTIPNTAAAVTAGHPTIIANPEYQLWNQHDQFVIGAIVSSLTENLILNIVGYVTSAEVWAALKRMYSS